jgi:hypothetical protein
MARYIFQGTFRDGQGNIIPDGTVTVFDAGTTTASTLYAASSGGTPVNSVTSDDNGFFCFYVDSSDYSAGSQFDITLSKSGYSDKTFEDVVIYGKGVSVESVAWDDDDMVFTLDDSTTITLANAKVDLKGAGITEQAVGFTAEGGTTSKTLTVDTDATISNLMLKTGSNLAIGSDADGDMYYRASSVLARLAKGTANHKLFMNAAGTAPEWASGIKLSAHTRDLAAVSGDVAYTGVGFKPSLIIFIAGLATRSLSAGASDATTHRCFFSTYGVTNSIDNAALVVSVDGANYQTAIVKTMDADGFTLTWTKTLGPTGTAGVNAICFR